MRVVNGVLDFIVISTSGRNPDSGFLVSLGMTNHAE